MKLKTILTLLLSLSLGCITFPLLAFDNIEICDNGIDDDGDGLIDCQDQDCANYQDCPQQFECPVEAYLFQYNDVYKVNLASGTTELAAVDIVEGNINACGYNNTDGMIWGSLTTPDKAIAKVGNNYATTVYIIEELPSANSYIGDVDSSGIYYLKPSGSTVYCVDVNPESENYGKFRNSFELSSNPNIADWAFNPVDAMLYTVTRPGMLIRIDVSTGDVTDIGLVPVLNGEQYTFGAVYFDPDGNLYISSNQTGTIYKITAVQDLNVGDAISSSTFAFGPTAGSNDGARCPLAEVPQEICGNGIDDDGDGLTDCEDPACTEYIDCYESDCNDGIDNDGDGLIDCDDPDCSNYENCDDGSSSGGEGGLESNSRLSHKIAARNYKRVKEHIDFDDPSELLSMDDYIRYRTPDHIEHYVTEGLLPASEVYITSPTDLLTITNATQIIAADYYWGETRKAAVLATKSENGPYEHTKYICDRFQGHQITDIFKSRIAGLIIAAFKRNDGKHEYNINLSAWLNEEDQWTLENHWTLDQYTQEKEYFNFQIWASTIEDLEIMAANVLKALNTEAQIIKFDVGRIPEVYISSVYYQNEEILAFVNGVDGNSKIDLDLVYHETETSNEIVETTQVSVSENVFQVKLGSVADVGMTIRTGDQQNDVIFVADGQWGIQENESTTIRDYEISQGSRGNYNEYWVGRDLHATGQYDEKFTAFRSLNPAFLPVDLDEYSNLNFSTEAEGLLEIVLVKADIAEWQDQPRYTVRLDGSKQTHMIFQKDFNLAAEGEMDFSDIRMITFELWNETGKRRDFDLKLTDVRFGKQERVEEDLDIAVSPNPVTDYANVRFQSSQQGISHQITLHDAQGKVIQSHSLIAQYGENDIQLILSNLPRGFYLIKLWEEDQLRSSQKVIK